MLNDSAHFSVDRTHSHTSTCTHKHRAVTFGGPPEAHDRQLFMVDLNQSQRRRRRKGDQSVRGIRLGMNTSLGGK